jgi:uncharacterized protein (TIGR00251 family)
MSDPLPAYIEPTSSGVVLRVFVAPRSATTKVLGLHDGMVKVALTAAPVEGAANKALVAFLAKMLGASKSSVTIIAGETSRKKIVSVEGIGPEEAIRRLGVE